MIKWWSLQVWTSYSQATRASGQKHIGVKGFQTLHWLTGKKWFAHMSSESQKWVGMKISLWYSLLEEKMFFQGTEGRFPFVNFFSHGWALHQGQGVKELPKVPKPIRTYPLSLDTWLPDTRILVRKSTGSGERRRVTSKSLPILGPKPPLTSYVTSRKFPFLSKSQFSYP